MTPSSARLSRTPSLLARLCSLSIVLSLVACWWRGDDPEIPTVQTEDRSCLDGVLEPRLTPPDPDPCADDDHLLCFSFEKSKELIAYHKAHVDYVIKTRRCREPEQEKNR